MRSDLGELKPGEEEIAELQLLLARRRDLITDQRVGASPASQRCFYRSFQPWRERWISTAKVLSPYSLTTRVQPSLDERATSALPLNLKNRGVKGSSSVAHRALSAAKTQSVSLPAQDVASRIVAELAREILALKERIQSVDEELERRFFRPPGGTDPHQFAGYGRASWSGVFW